MSMDWSLNIKITIFPKLIYRLNAISMRIPNDFFIVDKPILKFTWDYKEPRVVKNNSEKKKLEN